MSGEPCEGTIPAKPGSPGTASDLASGLLARPDRSDWRAGVTGRTGVASCACDRRGVGRLAASMLTMVVPSTRPSGGAAYRSGCADRPQLITATARPPPRRRRRQRKGTPSRVTGSCAGNDIGTAGSGVPRGGAGGAPLSAPVLVSATLRPRARPPASRPMGSRLDRNPSRNKQARRDGRRGTGALQSCAIRVLVSLRHSLGLAEACHDRHMPHMGHL